MRKILLLLVALAAVPCPSFAQGIETGFLDRSLHVGGTPRHYQVFVPRAYDPTREWPVVLFLSNSPDASSLRSRLRARRAATRS